MPLSIGGGASPTVMLCAEHHGQVHDMIYPTDVATLTRIGLAKARARGVQLGNPQLRPGTRALVLAAVQVNARQADDFAQRMAPHLAAIQAAGITSLLRIAAELNRRRLTTRHGGTWHAATVARLLKRIAALD